MCTKAAVLTGTLPAPGHAGLLRAPGCSSHSGAAAVSQLWQPHGNGSADPAPEGAPKGLPLTPAAPAVGICSSPIFQCVKPPGFSGMTLNPPATLTTPRLCHSLILRFSSVLSLRDPFAPQTAFSDEEQPSEQADYTFIKLQDLSYLLCPSPKFPAAAVESL